MSTARAVLFDLDGTLVDTAGDLVAALYVACDHFSIERPGYDDARRAVANGGAGLIARGFPDSDEARRKAALEILLTHYASDIADKLFGDSCRWSVLAAGNAHMPRASTASQMGGNVRVGLEDSLFISRGQLAASNAQQVAKIRRIVEDLGSDVATPEEAREVLDLKGGDRVNF